VTVSDFPRALTEDDFPCQALLDTGTPEAGQEHVRTCATCQAAETVIELDGHGGGTLTLNITERKV